MTTAWPSRRLQDLLGIDLPFVQAPMAGASLSAMAIAVSEAGALGSLPCAMLTPEQAGRELDAIRSGTRKPFNVNFFCHRPPRADAAAEGAWRRRLAPYYAEFGLDPAAAATGATRTPFDESMCALVEERRPRVVSFHFGLPDDALLERVRKTGARILSSATTVEEARWLEGRGCDAIIAQGLEAGGHRGVFLTADLQTQLGTFSLVPLIASAVKVPVIAAGGIMDGRGIAAAFALGASGVQLGTAYLFCPESTISAAHRALLSQQDGHTAVTNVMTGRPARGILTRLMREVGPMSPDAPAFPLAGAAVAPLRAAAEARGSGDFSPLWAGQAFQLGRPQGAAELTRTLAEEALAHLAALAPPGPSQPGTSAAIWRTQIERSGMTPVGMTARWIAASRAVETERDDAIFRDPLARDLAGEEGFAMRRAISGMVTTVDDRDPQLAIRTRFFDDALDAWAGEGATQVLMLAAGMNSRAFRLEWPDGTVLYEVDRADVFDRKEKILERLGVRPRCERRVVGADVAGDWVSALLKAGFDPGRATTVLAEGLVMYLEEAAAQRLFETLRGLVPAGSRLGMDIVNRDMLTSAYTATFIKTLEEAGCPWKFGVASPEAFLQQHGWSGTLTQPGDAEANYGIWPFPPIPSAIPDMPRTFFVRAVRAGASV
jgi:nitronate monooxygenase